LTRRAQLGAPAEGRQPWQRLVRRLVVDLSATRFIDSSGLNVFVRAYRQLGRCREALVLRGATPMASTLLRITGLDQILTIESGFPGRDGASRNGDHPAGDQPDTA